MGTIGIVMLMVGIILVCVVVSILTDDNINIQAILAVSICLAASSTGAILMGWEAGSKLQAEKYIVSSVNCKEDCKVRAKPIDGDGEISFIRSVTDNYVVGDTILIVRSPR